MGGLVYIRSEVVIFIICETAYRGMTLTWRAVSPSSLSVWLNDPKFSNEQRMASVRCFSRMNDHRLFMPPWLPALTSIGRI